MKNLILTLGMLFLCTTIWSQELAREATLFNLNKEMVAIEREYIIDSNSKLFCRFDGEYISFKYVIYHVDSTIVRWKKERLGDPTINFCLACPQVEFSNKRLKCTKENKTEYVEIHHGFAKKEQIIAALRLKNIQLFQNYKDITPIKDIAFDVTEKFSYKKGKLIEKTSFDYNQLVSKVNYSFYDNGLNLLKYNSILNTIISQDDLEWNKDTSVMTWIRKEYVGHSVKRMEYRFQIKDGMIYSNHEDIFFESMRTNNLNPIGVIFQLMMNKERRYILDIDEPIAYRIELDERNKKTVHISHNIKSSENTIFISDKLNGFDYYYIRSNHIQKEPIFKSNHALAMYCPSLQIEE